MMGTAVNHSQQIRRQTYALQAGQGPSIENALTIAETSPELQAAVEPAISAFLDATADYVQQHGHLPALASPDALLRARMLAGRCAGIRVLTAQQGMCRAGWALPRLREHPNPCRSWHSISM